MEKTKDNGIEFSRNFLNSIYKAREICGQLEEGSGKRYKELVEEIGITTDEEANVSLENDKTTRMKKGEI